MQLITKHKYIKDAFPIYKIEEGYIISKDGDITYPCKLQLPEVFTFSSSEYEAMHDVLVRGLKLFMPHTIIHKQDWYTTKEYTSDIKDEYLAESYEKHFASRPYLHHESYLFITLTTKSRARAASRFSSLSRTLATIKEVNDRDRLSRHKDIIAQFMQIINDSNIISISPLSSESSTEIMQRYLSLDSSELQDIIISDDNESFKIGDNYVSAQTISSIDQLPTAVYTDIKYDKFSTEQSSCNLSYASPIGLLLPYNHIVNQYIIIENNNDIEKDLISKSKLMKAFAKQSSLNIVHSEKNEKYVEKQMSEQLISCRTHINIIAWSEDQEKLRIIRNDIGSAIAQMGCTPYITKVNAPHIFWSGIPGNSADLSSNETFLSFTLPSLCFFLGETVYQNSLSPLGIKLSDRQSGKPVSVDLWHEPYKTQKISNWNKFILGSSGSGKSFFTNTMIRQFYEMGNHVVMIDVGDSYKGQSSYIKHKTKGEDGIYFTYTHDNPISFNPFYVKDNKYDIEKKEYLKALILTLWKKEDEALRRIEEVALSTAMELYCELVYKGEIYPIFNTFYEFLRDRFPIEAENRQYREKDFDLHALLNCLEPFYQGGEYDYLLNNNESVDLLQKRFIVFELDNIKDHKVIFPVVTFMIMDTFVAKMRHIKNARKMIVIEEAWKAIAKNSMAQYIQYLVKTARKHDSELVLVTQELDDILGNTIIKDSIINNSDTKIILDMRKYLNKFDKIQNLLGLSNKEKDQILSINLSNDPKRKYKEVWIGMNGYSSVFATEVSPQEYYTYTTTASEKNKFFSVLSQKNNDFESALEEITK